MSAPRVPTLRWLAIPAAITLTVTLLRLLGELQAWDTRWFGTQAGGGASLFGIAWLIPVFGLYFAVRLIRVGAGPTHRGRALLRALVGAAILVATMTVVISLVRGAEPSMNFVYLFGGVGVLSLLAAWIGCKGWPELGRLTFGYGLAARLPIVALTFVLVPLDQGTHFERPAPFFPADMSDLTRTLVLCYAQVTFWIGLTMLVGLLLGALASFVVPRGRG